MVQAFSLRQGPRDTITVSGHVLYTPDEQITPTSKPSLFLPPPTSC